MNQHNKNIKTLNGLVHLKLSIAKGGDLSLFLCSHFKTNSLWKN